MINPKQIEKVVVILYYGRSGSIFLGSLLDGHPNVLSTPACIMHDFFSHFWPNFSNSPKEKLILSFTQYYSVLFDARNPSGQAADPKDVGALSGLTQMGDDKNKVLQVNVIEFIDIVTSYLSREENITPKYFFQVVYMSYALASGRDLDQNDYWICFPMHIPDKNQAAGVTRLFPETFFVQTIRDTVQTLNSHFRHHCVDRQNDEKVSYGLFHKLFAHNLFGGQVLVDKYGYRTKAVKLEDLHQNSQHTLRNLCEWLGFPWSDTLLNSTFNSLKWWNLKGSPQVSGFSTKTIDRKREKYITPFDRFRLNLVLSRKRKHWEYGVSIHHSSLLVKIFALPLMLLPFKMEKVIFELTTEESADNEIVNGYSTTRILLLSAWISSFIKQRNEVSLLGNPTNYPVSEEVEIKILSAKMETMIEIGAHPKQIFEVAISKFHAHPDFYLMMAIYLTKINRLDGAIDVLSKGINCCEEQSDLLYMLALTEYNANNKDKSAEIFQGLVNSGYRKVEVFNALGLIYLEKKQLENAKKSFMEASLIDPFNLDIWDKLKTIGMETTDPKVYNHALRMIQSITS